MPADLIISYAPGRAEPVQAPSQQKACAQGLLSLVVSLPGFRVDGVQEDAMTTAALAEKGQVGFARSMRWLDGLRVSVLYLGQVRIARIDRLGARLIGFVGQLALVGYDVRGGMCRLREKDCEEICVRKMEELREPYSDPEVALLPL